MSVSDAEQAALIEAVRTVAKAEITPRFRALSSDEVDQKSGVEDLVTVADKRAEVAITAAVRDILPGTRVVGEEAVAVDASLLSDVGKPGRTVIIDPIDGTWNFANGIATFGVILAVVEDGETVMGLLYDPVWDDWVVARKGEGAWFSAPGKAPRRLRVSTPSGDLEDAFGFIGLYLFDKPGQVLLCETMSRFRRTANLRCSCHEYRMIVDGKADFMLTGMLNSWDHAAGVLAFREAGGVARLLDGPEYAPSMTHGRLLIAATEELWAELAGLWAGLK
ncbi:MAG: inositol monophosphatase [Pseudomonadota bacterium]